MAYDDDVAAHAVASLRGAAAASATAGAAAAMADCEFDGAITPRQYAQVRLRSRGRRAGAHVGVCRSPC